MLSLQAKEPSPFPLLPYCWAWLLGRMALNNKKSSVLVSKGSSCNQRHVLVSEAPPFLESCECEVTAL